MAYGKIKADTFVYDNSGSDVEVTLSSLGNKVDAANPTFTGTVTIPTPTAGDNTTKAASTAFVVAGFAPKDAPAFTGTATGANLTLSGTLTVQGTTTTISSTTIDVADKNIELGKVSTPTDTTADGGGITLKGASDKTFNWVDATDAWTSSEHIHVGDNKEIKFGDSSDFIIKHNGSDILLRSVTGTGNIRVEPKNGELGIICVPDSYTALYYDSSKKIETTAAGVTVTGTVTDSLGDVRKIPRLNKDAAYTITAADAGKTITTSAALTIPNSVMAEGDAITIVNKGTSDITITQGSGMTVYNSADASTGNRTLAGRGMATIWFTTASYGYISGAGLS